MNKEARHLAKRMELLCAALCCLGCHGGQLRNSFDIEPPSMASAASHAAAGGTGGNSGGARSSVNSAANGHCVAGNVCTEAYPCQSLDTGYSCRGQFADWPVRDSPNTFQDNTNGTVTDTRTGLVWQQAVDANKYAASEAAQYCERLSLEGGDWRVPAISELESIVDYTREDPAIDPRVFPNTPREVFRSSSLYSGPAPKGTVWLVHFGSGGTRQEISGGPNRVRCVRSVVRTVVSYGIGAVPPDRYVVSDDTVSDTRTGLTWQRRVGAAQYTQTSAIAYCQSLSLAAGGWRLPAISELQTLVDRTRARPAIDQVAFDVTGGAGPANFWSSTRSTTSVWGMDFSDGQPFNGSPDSETLSARCVR
jgi:hypothetical protein